MDPEGSPGARPDDAAAGRRLWAPSAERSASTRLARVMERAGFADYASMHEWSVREPDAFWSLVWDDCGVVGERGDRVVVPGRDFASTRFFPDAALNVAENLLAPRDGVDEHGEAVVALDETGRRRSLTWIELRSEVAAMAAALRGLGVVAGDRVAVWMPVGVEALVVMLGAAAIGAVSTSTSPDFGALGVLDRFGQVEPAVLFAVDGYDYGGRRFDCLARLEQVRAGLPGLRATVVAGTVPPGVVAYEDLLAPHRGVPLEAVRLPFDHPWYVLYSSGTTGVPKCIVHRAGGVLLTHLKEHQLHCDVRAGDRVFYFTTTGWMMWNWVVSALASGATPVLFDGSPTHPSSSALLDLAERERVTLLGVSAKYLESLRKSGLEPITSHDLASLRTICSTGSPLSPVGFEFVYEKVKADVHLASISGGTDLCGCLVAGNPTGPVHSGEIQVPALGMAIDVYDDDGASLRAAPGSAGELVCTAPFPSMPLGFWGDDAGVRYRRAYFERFPGVWAHGDFATWTRHGGIVILGRSDATLNPGGVRIGTAEIYRVVDAMPEVLESLAFGQRRHDDVRVVLLVHLVDGCTLDEALEARIRAVIRTGASPRHVPAVIAQVHDLPRTRSNKLVEIAVADAVHGRPVRNLEALANPEAIDAIASLPELGE